MVYVGLFALRMKLVDGVEADLPSEPDSGAASKPTDRTQMANDRTPSNTVVYLPLPPCQ